MTDTPAEVEAARALVAAYDALNSPEHAAEAEKLRELSLKVSARAEAFNAAQAALHAANKSACANGTPPAPNVEAAEVINGLGYKREIHESRLFTGWKSAAEADLAEDGVVDLTDMPHSYPDEDDIPEEQTARANGADYNA
jgi:hypothetical protein